MIGEALALLTAIGRSLARLECLRALVESVTRHNVTAVVLRSVLHFAVLGASQDIKGMFGRVTGAQVMILDPP
ncbi:hypothetical protein GCM10029976_092950 [Kribbella albertanoniae]|uniref:ANTAR domain-containing protein n=1 Tax=Kribbella albertanoniae TaxID=1266829 RepID=A0A4R4QCE8_9ACTN|nr:hypothetical protein [Kribbella albertanoniae]TDC33161.1 hypothetical protein E1261_06635 [Kribbella albertanoniae]